MGEPPTTVGIEFIAKIDNTSGADGTVVFLQNGKVRITETNKNGNEKPVISADDQWYLDQNYLDAPYYPGDSIDTLDVTPDFKDTKIFIASDSPFRQLYHFNSTMTIKEDFRMYLMFLPRNATSYDQAVPLGRIEWGWNASLENRATQIFWNDWAILSADSYSKPWERTNEMPVLNTPLPY
jgi:hypothetical protein